MKEDITVTTIAKRKRNRKKGKTGDDTKDTDGQALDNEDTAESDSDSSDEEEVCLLYTSPSPRDKRQSRMPSSA